MDQVCSLVEKGITNFKAGKYEVTLVAHRNIPSVFPQVEKLIVDFFERENFREFTVEHLYARLLTGEAQLWLVGENGVRLVLLAVTRIVKYPGVKRMAIDLILGEDLEGCVPLLDVGETWAKQLGCEEVEATCRPGVRKVMQKHGFGKVREVIVRPIAGRLN